MIFPIEKIWRLDMKECFLLSNCTNLGELELMDYFSSYLWRHELTAFHK